MRSVPGAPLVQESAGSAGFWDGSCCPIDVPTSQPLLIHSPGMLWDELMIQLGTITGAAPLLASQRECGQIYVCTIEQKKRFLLLLLILFLRFIIFPPIKVTYHMELCFVIIPFLPREGFWIIQESQSWPGPLFTWHLSSPSLRQPQHSLSPADCGPPSPCFSQLPTRFQRGWHSLAHSLAFLASPHTVPPLQGGRALLVVPQDDRGVGHVWRGAEHWLRHWGAGYRTARGHRVSERRRRRQGRRILWG